MIGYVNIWGWYHCQVKKSVTAEIQDDRYQYSVIDRCGSEQYNNTSLYAYPPTLY